MKSATGGTDKPSVSGYTVTFHANGGTHADFTQEVQSGGKATLPTPPARQGYTLDGWYKDEALNTPYNFDSTVSADITLYAKWKPLTFAVLLIDMAADAAANTEKTYTLPSGSETYILAITPLTTANSPASVVIDGGGRVVTGSTNRITIGAGVTLTLKNITFKKVPFTVSAGGTLVLDDGAVVTENAGAGVTVSGTSATAKGTLEMRAGASVTKNGDSGVRMEGTGGVFTMGGGTISGNTATNRGGGVALTGTDGTFTMGGGTISGNTVSNGGGGVAMLGTGSKFYMNGGLITGNKAQNGGCGGGVYGESQNAVFNMTAGEISNNTASEGGGVALWKDKNITFNMSGGVIKNNEADNDGGGVHLLLNNTFTMTRGEITGNTAAVNGGGVAAPAITGGPQIGGNNHGTAKGWIHGNTPNDVRWT
jgi:uncharacterized repeat protein (TIGR02543 family)